MTTARLLLGLLCLGTLSAEPARTFTVSPAGNDGAAGTAAAPFATLTRARDAIRALKAAGPLPAGGVAVQVRAGTYELTQTLKLTAQDAGTAEAPVVYRARPGERVVLTGTRRVTGFQPHQGRILKADLAAQGLKGVRFKQVLLDGQRQILARYPNFDPDNPHGGGFAYVDGEPLNMYQDLPTEELRVIHLRARDRGRRWQQPERGEVIIYPRYNWLNIAVGIAAADPQAGTIALAKDISWGPFKGIRPLDRFYVRNLLEELDAPGEWYLDADHAVLYYQPPKPLAGAEVRVPVVETLLDFGRGADWITVRGFTLEGCDGPAVNLREASHCRIAGNTIHDTGSSIGWYAGVQVWGGRDCGVVGNDLYEVANYGIRLESAPADLQNLQASGHFADNNYVHHIGHLNGHGCGIAISGVGQRVSHNLIHDTTRCGVFGGGPDCVVEYNRIRHVNLETEDTGATYMGGAWHIRGMVYRHNFITDVLGYGRTKDRWTSPHFAWGIYLDDDLSGVHVYGNIVARTTLGGCDIHAGRDNLVENNILVDGRHQQMMYQGHERSSWVVAAHWKEYQAAMARPAWQARYPELVKGNLEELWQMAGNRFLRNVISYRADSARLYSYWPADAPTRNQTDYNLIWHHGRPVNLGLPGTAEQQWAAWQAKGYDAHSVIADPRFVDADRDDYRLRPDSPAWQLGFKAIPVERIGPYADELRATWPIVEARGVREVPLRETVVELPPTRTVQPPQARVPRGGEVTLSVARRPDGSAVAGAPATARLTHDGTRLIVTVTVPLRDASKLQRGRAWGSDDAAELCFRDLSGAAPGPTFVSHGFAGGHQECVSEAGAPEAASQRLAAAIGYEAKVAAGQWTARWTVPLAAAGINLKPGLKLGCNVGVRRSESGEWLQWHGTGATWHLDQAGGLVLE